MGGGEPARWVLVWGGQRWRWHRRRRRRCRRRRGAWAAAWDRLWATVARVAAVPNQGRRRYVSQVWQRQGRWRYRAAVRCRRKERGGGEDQRRGASAWTCRRRKRRRSSAVAPFLRLLRRCCACKHSPAPFDERFYAMLQASRCLRSVRSCPRDCSALALALCSCAMLMLMRCAPP